MYSASALRLRRRRNGRQSASHGQSTWQPNNSPPSRNVASRESPDRQRSSLSSCYNADCLGVVIFKGVYGRHESSRSFCLRAWHRQDLFIRLYPSSPSFSRSLSRPRIKHPPSRKTLPLRFPFSLTAPVFSPEKKKRCTSLPLPSPLLPPPSARLQPPALPHAPWSPSIMHLLLFSQDRSPLPALPPAPQCRMRSPLAVWTPPACALLVSPLNSRLALTAA